MSTPRSIAIALLILGAIGGAALVEYWRTSSLPIEAQGDGATDRSRLDADINQLKGTVPSQSHAMADVAYHWNNLWFAAQKQNWPLAQFYFDESRSHMLWTIRIRPVRKAPDGQPVDLNSIFESIDTSTLTPVKAAIAQKD